MILTMTFRSRVDLRSRNETRNSTNGGHDKHATLLCLSCTEKPCNGWRRGCAFDREYGENGKPVSLRQESCGYPEPYADKEVRATSLRRINEKAG